MSTELKGPPWISVPLAVAAAAFGLLSLHNTNSIWFPGFILTLGAFLCSLFVDRTVPRHRKVGICYLIFVGLLYVCLGAIGFVNSVPDDFLVRLFYSFSPAYSVAAFIHAIRTWQILDFGTFDPGPLSIPVFVIGMIVVVSAVAMSRKIKFASAVCCSLVVVSLVASLLSILPPFGRAPGGYLSAFSDPLYPLLCSASYALAYWFAQLD